MFMDNTWVFCTQRNAYMLWDIPAVTIVITDMNFFVISAAAKAKAVCSLVPCPGWASKIIWWARTSRRSCACSRECRDGCCGA
jgi:hypothetical protein